MGRRSNAVLVAEDRTILDALRRASREKNPGRPILPHVRYAPPPPQSRLDPRATDTWEGPQALAAARPDGLLADLLAGELRGFSPLLAREAAFRAAGRADAAAGSADWSAVRAAVGELLAPIGGAAPWSPSVARRDGAVVAFAAYRLRHLEGEYHVEDVGSISEAIEQAYADGIRTEDRPASGQLARPLLDAIDARRAVVERRQAALARTREAAGDPDELREAGQLILASVHQIQPEQESLIADGREIRLDPKESPVENAQRYFRDYKRARDSARRVPELLQQATHELAYLDEMRTLAELAEDPGRIRALREELRSSGVLKDGAPRSTRKRRPSDDGARPITVPLADGFVALVGTSARSNERVTFDLAGQQDVWLHARQLPGAHVVLRTGGREPPRPVLVAAARLAAQYSRGREAGRVPVDWTLRKYVRKIRGGPAGLVSYINEQTIEVAPAEAPSPSGRGSG
jgi:predicted ribosome quality control (RQC) complex YloA/Tae2 family protein